MTTPNLAKIEREPDLTKAWPREAQDFTPWLAENISELSEVLGMDLVMEETEAPVGSYRLDILASESNQGRPVIIENQLGVTDHGHLGQLLTYAAGFDAGVVVWVTRDFRDEHRQALDWLNQRTGEETLFFGVVVELWQIGGSPLAPHFRLVASPNEWGKKKRQKGTPQGSERSERYREFFQSLVDALRERGFTTARTGRDKSWFSFPTGYRGTSYGAAFTSQKQARVELYIDVGNSNQNIDLLESLELSKNEIESKLGTLEWQRLESRRACRIALNGPGSIDDNDATLAQVRHWMVENLLKFKKEFDSKLKELSGNQSPLQEPTTIE